MLVFFVTLHHELFLLHVSFCFNYSTMLRQLNEEDGVLHQHFGPPPFSACLAFLVIARPIRLVSCPICPIFWHFGPPWVVVRLRLYIEREANDNAFEHISLSPLETMHHSRKKERRIILFSFSKLPSHPSSQFRQTALQPLFCIAEPNICFFCRPSKCEGERDAKFAQIALSIRIPIFAPFTHACRTNNANVTTCMLYML